MQHGLPGRAVIDLVHVSYKGGKLRALAFTSSKRVPDAPDLPTFAESGYPNIEVLSWYGIPAPAGTPPDIVRKLNADINRILQSPDVRERLTALGAEPTGGLPEQFAETIKTDTARWAKVVAEANIKID